MAEILYRRQGLRETLYTLFGDMPNIKLLRVALTPSEFPAAWLDLGIEYKADDADQGEEPIWAVQWFIKAFVDVKCDTTGAGSLDLAMDKAVDEIDAKLRTWQGSPEIALPDGRIVLVQSIEKVSAIPAPNDKEGKGVITYPGIMKFIEVF